ncbi:MAG: hypothetical protein RL497_190 [Pseudomonadota bacterium]|jgi:hypothetical protein
MYPTDPQEAVARWLQDVVIGLNLCPFARKPFLSNAVRIHVVDAQAEVLILEALRAELAFLTAHPELETTLIVLTQALGDFLQYNDFLHFIEDWLWQNEYEGVYQVASFHPHYCFADTAADDVENFTNRAPFPLLHILREDSLEELLARYPDADEIPFNNIRRLKQLSQEQLRGLFPYISQP